MSLIDIALKIKAKNGVLQAFIDEREWTQADFARQIGVSESEVGRWFNMTGFPRTPLVMVKVMDLLNKPAEEIFPPPLMDKDWLTGSREWTVYKDIDSDCLPLHHVVALPSHRNEIDEHEIKANITAVLQTLTPREREVINMRMGLNGEGEHTREQIANIFGVSIERIRQIEACAIRKLKQPWRLRILNGEAAIESFRK